MEKLFFQTPYCQFHPTEKVLRICTNISCQRYFQLACIECLDTHNHNIQELIKIKEFFAQISSQTGGPQMNEKDCNSQNSSKKNSFDISTNSHFSTKYSINNNNESLRKKSLNTVGSDNENANCNSLKNQKNQKNQENQNSQQQMVNLKQMASEDFEFGDINNSEDDDEEEVQILNGEEQQKQQLQKQNEQEQCQQNLQNFNIEEFEMIVGGARQEEGGLQFQQPDILDDQLLDDCFTQSPRDSIGKKEEQKLEVQSDQNLDESNHLNQKKQEQYIKIHQIQTLMQQMSGIIQIADIIKSDLEKMESGLQGEIQNSSQGVVNKLLREIAQITENDSNFQEVFYKKIEKLKSYLNKDQNKIQVKTNETQEIQQVLDVYSNVFSAEIANTFKSLNQLAGLDFQNFKKTYSCKFNFSPILKGRNILLGNGNKVALQQSSEERFIMLEPQINQNIKTRWAFRILDTGAWIGVGMANKDIIQLEKYQFTKYTGNGRHGSYMFSNNGYSWNYMQQYCNMQMNNFQYKSKDIILLEYNPKYKRLVAINLEEKKVCVMDIQGIEQQFKHHPCVNMCQGAKIQILDNFIWPSEQILKDFKETGKKDFSFLLDYRP